MADFARHVKQLKLTPDSVLLVNRNRVEVKDLMGLKMNLPYTVPVLIVDGEPERAMRVMTRAELMAALTLLDGKKEEEMVQ